MKWRCDNNRMREFTSFVNRVASKDSPVESCEEECCCVSPTSAPSLLTHPPACFPQTQEEEELKPITLLSLRYWNCQQHNWRCKMANDSGWDWQLERRESDWMRAIDIVDQHSNQSLYVYIHEVQHLFFFLFIPQYSSSQFSTAIGNSYNV